MRLVLRRAAQLLTLALLTTGLTGLAAPSANAATMVRECKLTGIGCVSFSGYAGRSVWGYPVTARGNNCVNYVAYRLAKNGVARQSTMGNGGSWASNARKRGFRVDRTPVPGSIAQWNYGSAYAPGYGHVGYVEEVTSSYIVISDSSYGGDYTSRWRVPRGDRNWPSNFIHFKDVGYKPPPSGTFVKVRETSATYRLAGAAPVRVFSTAGLGTIRPMLVSSTSLARLPKRVPDGTFLRGSVRGDVYRVTGGAPVAVASWTSMGGRKPYTTVDQTALDRAGGTGDYSRLRRYPADGTVLQERTSRALYVVRSGKALRFTTWSQIGGWRRSQVVDPAAIARAGTSVFYGHLAGRGTLAPAA
ncbi:CHAP domain-containing protein [Knoellia koreensis]|uniref:CHAP domain-containing protein n=1 Tax=Knoellia koreensis TaxID=2730921 RepID=A0A849HBV0_9MICO|nr:CHAP domain-containing protein [Knoellia sp. DB2414S]NNM45415.1 CHAP domain-containing protein [Knoellia sp. DB2414S]